MSVSGHGQHTGKVNAGEMAALMVGATGVVFGDIGTSPIYALKQTFMTSGTQVADIYGVISLVFWTLTLIVSLKYLTFVMRADNNGEGGILALLALLPKKYLNPNKPKQKILLLTVLIGTALLFGDGVLTPAISVLSAVEGLELVNEGFAGYSVPITVGILTALFWVQKKGTHTIGAVFGPVMIGWFLLLGGLGAYRFVDNPSVIKALLPTYAVQYVIHHGLASIALLGSIILAVTGAEALYADMGHFGATPIRRAWFFLAGPALILCYLGQAAVVIENPQAVKNPFFSLPPNATMTLVLVFAATAATVIASQALITGVFSLTRQATQLGLFPRLQIRHTSAEHEGQIYVGAVNWLVGIAAIGVVIVFQTSTALAHAYVLAICGTMTVTTIAFHNVARDVWGWTPRRLYPLTALFLFVDLSFLAGTASSFLHGGWVPVVLGALVLGMMLIWRNGYRALGRYMAEHSLSWDTVSNEIEHGSLSRIHGIGVFMASPAEEVPAALASQAKMLRSIPADVLVVTVVGIQRPYSDQPPRVEDMMSRARRVTIYAGYMESVNVPKVLHDHVLGEMERVATYYLSERRFLATDDNQVRRFPEILFSFLHRNSATATQFYALPGERVVTIGTRIDL